MIVLMSTEWPSALLLHGVPNLQNCPWTRTYARDGSSEMYVASTSNVNTFCLLFRLYRPALTIAWSIVMCVLALLGVNMRNEVFVYKFTNSLWNIRERTRETAFNWGCDNTDASNLLLCRIDLSRCIQLLQETRGLTTHPCSRTHVQYVQ